jgi:acetoin utilization deacetylase AcuC-like enzyme
VNLPLPAGTADGAYLAALDDALALIADHDAPTMVVSLGMDTYGLDPIGSFRLTSSGYTAMGRRVAEIRRPTVILQEGGYHVGDLGVNVVAWLRGFAPAG